MYDPSFLDIFLFLLSGVYILKVYIYLLVLVGWLVVLEGLNALHQNPSSSYMRDDDITYIMYRK